MHTLSTQLQKRSFHIIERTRTSPKCQKMKNARAKRAKILFFSVKYANFWGFCCRHRRGCLSSLVLHHARNSLFFAYQLWKPQFLSVVQFPFDNCHSPLSPTTFFEIGVYLDQQLICDILLRLSALWKRVIAPEIIEMRVPRDLKPFVMSSSFLTVAPHNANVSHGNSDEFDLSNDDIAGVSHGNSDEFGLSNDDIANVSHGNGNEFDISNRIMYPMTMVIIAVVCLI